MFIGLHVKYSLLLSDLKMLEFAKKIVEEILKYQISWKFL